MSQSDRHSITVAGRAERRAAPDRARWWIILGAFDAVEREAMGRCTAQASNLIAAIRRVAGDNPDLSTASVRLSPRWDGDRKRYVGFDASVAVEVVCKLEQAGAVAAQAMSAGAQRINGPDFEIAEPEPFRVELLADAVEAARAKAECLANAAGRRLGRVLSISERGVKHHAGGGFIVDHMQSLSGDSQIEIVAADETIAVDLVVSFEFAD
jgi:uncharacterized protein YggE